MMKHALLLSALFATSLAVPLAETDTELDVNSSVEVDETLDTEVKASSVGSIIVPPRITSNLTALIQYLVALEVNRTKQTLSNLKNLTSAAAQQLVQKLPIRPYAYPDIASPLWSPYLLRVAPYQHPFYQPYPHQGIVYPPLMRQEFHLAGRPFPSNDQLTQQDALRELESIKQENNEDNDDVNSRILFPSIALSPDHSSVTISYKSFLSLLSSLSSRRVTVSVTTRTVFVPGLAVSG